MIQKIRKNLKEIITITLILTIFLITGLKTFRDYGVSWDEPIERYTSIVTFKYIYQKLNPSGEQIPFFLAYGNLPDIKDKYYGTALYQPMVLVEYFRNFKMDISSIYKMRHLWNFLNYFLASFFFYQTLKLRFKNWKLACLGLVFFIVTPRLYGESFYNLKDILFYSWFQIALYFFARFIYRSTLTNGIFLGLAIGIAANTRIVGILILVFAMLYLFLEAFFIKKPVSRKRILSLMLVVPITSYIVWFVITPAAWERPIEHLKGTITQFSNFQFGLGGMEFYLGEFVSAGNLPWHYILVWLFVTMPILYSFLFVTGFISCFINIRKVFLDKNILVDLFFMLNFLIPVIGSILFHSVLYNGWRHMYFIYGPFLYIALLGYSILMNRRSNFKRNMIRVLSVISLCLNISWMINNHPNQMVYFNVVVRKNYGDLFERDYWRLSTKEALDYILSSDQSEKISIHEENFPLVFSNAIDYLPGKERERIYNLQNENSLVPADYIIYSYSTNGGYSEKMDDYLFGEISFPFYSEVYNVSVDGYKLCSVYKYNKKNLLPGHQIVIKTIPDENESSIKNIVDNDINTSFQINEKTEIEIELNDFYNVHRFSLY